MNPYKQIVLEWLGRIWKYRLHYVIVLPGLLMIGLFKLIPFVALLRLSMSEFSFVKGLFGGDWIGLDHFRQQFSSPDFRQAFSNTLIIKCSCMMASGVVSYLLALSLSIIPSAKLRNGFAALFLVPFFLPSAVLASTAIYFLSPSETPLPALRGMFVLVHPYLFRVVLILLEIVKACGIPIVIALAAMISNPNKRLVLGFKAVSAVILIQLSALLSTDFELIHSLYNPLVYSVSDTLDTYGFRVGLIELKLDVYAVVEMFQIVVQVILALLAYALIRSFFADALFFKPKNADYPPQSLKTKVGAVGIAGASIYGLFVLALLYAIFVFPFLHSTLNGSGWVKQDQLGNGLRYFLLYLTAALFHLLLTATLAYPLTVKNLPGRGLYKLFLLFSSVIGTNAVGEYLLYQQFGMVNTVYPLVIGGLFGFLNVFVVKSIFNSKHAERKEAAFQEGRGELHSFFFLYLPNVWKPLVGLGILQFAMQWNSYLPAMIYLNDPSAFPPIMRFVSLYFQAGKEAGLAPVNVLRLGAVVSFPPMILFLVLRKLLTSEVWTSQTRNG